MEVTTGPVPVPFRFTKRGAEQLPFPAKEITPTADTGTVGDLGRSGWPAGESTGPVIVYH